MIFIRWMSCISFIFSKVAQNLFWGFKDLSVAGGFVFRHTGAGVKAEFITIQAEIWIIIMAGSIQLWLKLIFHQNLHRVVCVCVCLCVGRGVFLALCCTGRGLYWSGLVFPLDQSLSHIGLFLHSHFLWWGGWCRWLEARVIPITFRDFSIPVRVD